MLTNLKILAVFQIDQTIITMLKPGYGEKRD